MSTQTVADSQAPIVETPTTPKLLADYLLDSSNVLPESLQPFWLLITENPAAGALSITLLSYFLAIILRAMVIHLASRVSSITETAIDNAVIDDLRKPVFYTIFFIGLSIAVAVVKLPAGGEVLIKLLASMIVASWMTAFIKISTLLLRAFSGENRYKLVEARTVPIFDLTSKLIIIMVGIYILLLIWGVNPIGWLASAGIAGLALGFAAKDTLANLFSGFFIVADAPYKIGDYIYLDSGERGKVCAIGLRSTRLLTRDDVEITIPNGVIANAKIINESGGPQNLRIRVVVGVAYGSDVDQVVELLLQAGHANPEVCQSPAPRVRLRGFGASSLDFNLMCWITRPEDRGRIIHELLMSIYKSFNEHQVEIPYAKQDVYIKQWPENQQ